MKLGLIKTTTQKFIQMSVFIFVLSNMVYGQDSTKLVVDSLEENNHNKYAISVAYFGETVTHPGLNLGVEYKLWERKKLKLITIGNIGWYTHPRHHHAAFLNIEGGLRSTTSFGLYSDFFLGFGYHHSWVNGDVYVSDREDNVKIIWNAGNPHLMLSSSFGLGWSFVKNKTQPVNVFVRIKPLFIYPVNHNILIQGAVMVGVIRAL